MLLMKTQTLIKFLHLVIRNPDSIKRKRGPNRILKQSRIEKEILIISNTALQPSFILIQLSQRIRHMRLLLHIPSLHPRSRPHSHIFQTIRA